MWHFDWKTRDRKKVEEYHSHGKRIDSLLFFVNADKHYQLTYIHEFIIYNSKTKSYNLFWPIGLSSKFCKYTWLNKSDFTI